MGLDYSFAYRKCLGNRRSSSDKLFYAATFPIKAYDFSLMWIAFRLADSLTTLDNTEAIRKFGAEIALNIAL